VDKKSLFDGIIPPKLGLKRSSYPQNRVVIHIKTALIHRKQMIVKAVFVP
jgi:hypothetical protein